MRTWQLIFLFTVGPAAIVGGILARLGIYRYWYRWYRDPELPVWLRNAAFAWIPTGVGFCSAGAVLLVPFGRSRAVIGLVLSGLFIISLVVAILFLLHPFESLKPDWLRTLEQGEASEHPPS